MVTQRKVMRKVSFHKILSGIWKLFVSGPNGEKGPEIGE